MNRTETRPRARGLRTVVAGAVALATLGAGLAADTNAYAAPSGVPNLSARVIGGDVIRLSWHRATNGTGHARSYQVQYSQSSSFPSGSGTKTQRVTGYAAGSDGVSPFYSATGLAYGRTYYLRVRACADTTGSCASGNAGPWSGRVSGKTRFIPGYGKKPSGLVVSNVASTSVELSFVNVSGAPGYRIRYRSRAGVKYYWSQVEELTLEGLSRSTEYWISAAVADPPIGNSPTSTAPTPNYTPSALQGSYSGEIKIRTSNYSIAAPSGVTISEQKYNSVKVTWVEPPQISGTDMARTGEDPQTVDPQGEGSEEPTTSASPTPSETPTPSTTPPASETPTATPTPTPTPTDTPTPVDSATPPGDADSGTGDAAATGGDATNYSASGDDGSSSAGVKAVQLATVRPAAAPTALGPSRRYRVEYATNKAMRSAKTKDSTTNSAVLTGLKSNTNYYVRVYVVQLNPTRRVSDKSAYQIAKTRVPSVTFTGIVKGLTGEQRKDAVATLYGSSGELVKQVDISGVGGRWTARVRPGTYRVKINYLGADGFTSAWIRDGAQFGTSTYGQATRYWIGTVGRTRELPEVTLQQGGSIAGYVLRAGSDIRLNGVDIAARTGQTSAREVEAVLDTPTTSGQDGSYRIEGLREGVHWIRFVKYGYKDLTVWLNVQKVGGVLQVTQIRFGGRTYTSFDPNVVRPQMARR